MTFDRNTETFADAGEEKIAGLLSTLPSVSAPSDFDFRVRARIAKGRPAVRPSWAPRLARIAVPAALLVGIGGYFGTGMLRQPTQPQVNQAGLIPSSPVAITPAPVVSDKPIVSEAPSQSQSQPEIARNPVKPSVPANSVTPANRKVEAAPKPTQSGPMSYDESGKHTTDFNVAGMKKMADAGVKISNNRVVTAPPGSGFQTGDQIISMTASSVTVRRDGKTVQITLK